jgi:Myb-like DNA-binding domain
MYNILRSDCQVYTERAMSRPLTPPSDAETPKPDDDTSADDASSMNSKWSLEDDRILLEHVLQNHKAQWMIVEQELQKKHTATLCSERWNCLKRKILDGYTSSLATRPTENKCNI